MTTRWPSSPVPNVTAEKSLFTISLPLGVVWRGVFSLKGTWRLEGGLADRGAAVDMQRLAGHEGGIF